MSRTPPLDMDGCAALLDVSRETLAPCAALLELLNRWQRAINLVGTSTLRDPWRRHVLDSGQIVPHLPSGSVVDLGSGAGFPGLVVSLLADREVQLIESDGRKAEFLREAARLTGARVGIHACRIEQTRPFLAAAVTARALAPLPDLLRLAQGFIGPATTCLLLKSGRLSAELTKASAEWHMVPEMFQSLSDPDGVLLKLKGITPCV